MEIDDPAVLAGSAADALLAGCSILHERVPLVVHADDDIDEEQAGAIGASLRRAPTVTVLVGHPATTPAALAAAADVCLTTEAEPAAPWVAAPVEDVVAAVADHAEAALALTALLRGDPAPSGWAGIAAEASTYGLLLASPDHRAWLHRRGPAAPRPHDGPPVRTTRDGTHLHVELDRVPVHNAIDATVRDALVEALAVPVLDPTVETVLLTGRGPTFCAGGDLQEFGSVPDAATSFAVRLTCHPGAAALRIADRLTAHVHGPCVGAGIEIPAFARRLVADPGATFRLPEVAMGLVPGAGGTVSIPARIGRARFAWLALTGHALDARTALAWGLVDALAPTP